ncbi:MAG: TolC family protein [Cyclobacteriaceae bacterium]|nr:TolC family protein [Cyclobacteriaceae bacterium]
MNPLTISTFRFIVILALSGVVTIPETMAQPMTETEAIHTALQNNQLIKSAEFEVDYYKQMKKTGSELGKLNVVWMRGQYNTIEKDNNITLTQTIPFPGTIRATLKLGAEQVRGADKNLQVAKNNQVFAVKSTYEQLLYQLTVRELLLSQDSLYTDFARASAIRYKTGESNLLEMTTAETQLQEIKNSIRINEADIYMSQMQLQVLLKTDAPVDVSAKLTKRILSLDSMHALESNPQIQLANQQVKINQQLKRVENSRLAPDFSIGYFNQTLIGYQNTTGSDIFYDKSNRFSGFTAGIQIPLWFAPQAARAKAASHLEEASRETAEYIRHTLFSEYEQALRELDKNQASLVYYESSALKNADLILSQARKAYQGGEIGYVEYLQSLRNAISIKSNYLQVLHQYNLSVIRVEFFIGKY